MIAFKIVAVAALAYTAQAGAIAAAPAYAYGHHHAYAAPAVSYAHHGYAAPALSYAHHAYAAPVAKVASPVHYSSVVQHHVPAVSYAKVRETRVGTTLFPNNPALYTRGNAHLDRLSLLVSDSFTPGGLVSPIL